jgi:hypothetical protein
MRRWRLRPFAASQQRTIEPDNAAQLRLDPCADAQAERRIEVVLEHRIEQRRHGGARQLVETRRVEAGGARGARDVHAGLAERVDGAGQWVAVDVGPPSLPFAVRRGPARSGAVRRVAGD